MDYMTKPISRAELRSIAKWFRNRFGCKNKLRFDVVDAFERLPFFAGNIVTQIIEDDDASFMPLDIPASCTETADGTIEISARQKIYNGACRGVGGYRAHLLHEMCHAVLIMMGFRPIMARAYANNQIEPCRSMEWQAKALTGEILVPYEETKGLSLAQIMFYCKVSKPCAETRLRLDENKKKKELPF